MTQFLPSEHQLAFFEELKNGSSSILLEAVAGSGKTTTIVHSTTLLSPHVLTVFLAFNKRIADELEARLPSHIQCGTFHSRANRALARALPKRPRIDKDKIRNLLKSNLKYSDFELYGQFCQKLISLGKSAGIGTELLDDTDLSWDSLISHFSLTLDSADASASRALELTRACFQHSASVLDVIDFDDMLYLALLRNVVFDKASFVFVDEAQDTNGVQRALLKRMITPGLRRPETHVEKFYEKEAMKSDSPVLWDNPPGRLIAVGDPHQSIYGFRGADASAMDLLVQEFSAKRLPLSISYRCSKAVVAEAQKYLK